MNKITFLIVLFASVVSAQDFTVMEGGTLSISSGKMLYLNGIELRPSIDYNLANPTNFSVINTPLSSPHSISNVVELSNPLENYQGNITFYYQNSELNDLKESDLELVVMDSGSDWINLESSIDLDIKSFEFTFDNPVSIFGVTAVEKQTLSSTDFDELSLKVFPNPTTSLVEVNYKNSLQIEVFDLLGSSLLKTKNNSVDLSNFSSGMYLMKIMDVQTNKSLLKKIIKK
ncbi:T9SS type A sorting domain-containing protein [Nonlabens antarcticus]|uniref:T9SS type A sorting domain-containing protein n=1 Tax=Nonlabens antarcticus TaxID=392714 RepID=UPI0018910E9A|nr:T9SS type A sorting domain-containing protein [Nonlabens antarcticus]